MAVLAVVQYEGKKLCGFAAEVTQTSGATLSLKNNTVFSHSPLWMWNEFLLRLWEAQQTVCISRGPTQMTSKSLKSNSGTLDHLLLLCRFYHNELNQSAVSFFMHIVKNKVSVGE